MGKNGRVMFLAEFDRKAQSAALQLCKLCPNGNPTHEQIFSVTREAGLPIFFGQSSYLLDPSASAVYYLAYEGCVRAEVEKFYVRMKNCLVNQR
jgi:hypothetical protein